MNITGSLLTAHSSLFSHCYCLFFLVSRSVSNACFASYVLLKKLSDTPTLFDHQQGLDEDDDVERI